MTGAVVRTGTATCSMPSLTRSLPANVPALAPGGTVQAVKCRLTTSPGQARSDTARVVSAGMPLPIQGVPTVAARQVAGQDRPFTQIFPGGVEQSDGGGVGRVQRSETLLSVTAAMTRTFRPPTIRSAASTRQPMAAWVKPDLIPMMPSEPMELT